MADLINVDALTLNAQEAQTVSEVIFERAFGNGPITEFHAIETGITMKKQIVFAGRVGMLGKASVGCTPNEAGGFAMTQKYWDPAIEDFRLEHCQADMPTLLKIFRKAQKMNPDFYDKSNSEEIGVIIAAVLDAMLESLMIKIWFNDTNSALIADSGVFTAGTDVDYFNTFDGLFKQIFAAVSGNKTPRYTISANAGSSYSGQALADDAALAILKGMYKKADSRLLSMADAQILVTRSIFDNYVDTLESKTVTNGFLERLENGTLSVKYRGIPVKMMEVWDRAINSYQNNGTKWNLPHRAVMTVKENIPVGTLNDKDFQSLDSFYDKKSKSNIIDGVYSIDAKHLEEYLTVAAY